MKRKILIISLLVAILLGTACIFSVFAETDSSVPELSFYSQNLSLNDNIYVIYYVTANNVSSNSDVNLLVWREPQAEYTKDTATKILKYKTTETKGGEPRLRFEYKDLAAKNMADTVYTRVHVSSGGKDYYSEVKSYSILQYTYNKLGKTGTAGSASLQLLLTQMLEYGAAAQTYFNHNTDRLATADFWQIKVEGGLLPDGCTRGLFLKNEEVLLTANEPADGMKFSGWKDSSGKIVATTKTLSVTVGSSNETYTAVFCAEDNSSYTKNVVAPTSLDEGYTIYTCSNCGDSFKANYTPATGSSGFTYTVNSDGETCTITGMGSCTDTVTMSIPEYIYSETDKKAYQVTAIGEHAFWKNQTLRTVYLPDSVTTIQMGAFSECPKLYEIQLPSKLVTIADWAFSYCSSLTTDLIVPKTLTSVGASAFVSCSKLTDVYYEGSAKEWANISISSSGNTYFTNAKRHYNFGYANDPENYIIEKATSSITIDANRDASYSSKVYIDHKLVTKSGYENVGEGRSVAWITYTDGYLYFYAEIEDSTLFDNPAANNASEDLFQIYIDYVNNHMESGLTGNAYRSAEGTSGAKKLGWIYVKPDGKATGSWGFSGVSLSSAAKKISGGYAIEVRVPFANASVMSDKIGIGFEVKDDTDNLGESDNNRDSVYYSTGIGLCYYNHYERMPDFVLSENYEEPAKTIDYTKVNVNLDGYKDATYKTKVEVNSPWSNNPANSKGFGEAWMTQDGKGLYIFFDVIDANPYNNDDNYYSEGDRVQVYLDFANNHASNGLSAEAYRGTYASTGYLGYIAVSPDGDVAGTYSFASHSGIEAITQKTAAGYSVELYVPFANSTVMSDTIGIGFEFQNDTDGVIGSNGYHSKEAIFCDTSNGTSYYNHYEWLPDYKIEEKPILTSFCMTDIHNNFAMLEPGNSTGDYVIRGTATLAIDQILATEGKVDVAVIGGDYMSDYPHWVYSGNLPYEYFLGYKAKTIETFSKLAEDGKVIYIAGNHDYGQGEAPKNDAPYNSFDFYFGEGAMEKTMGILDDGNAFWKIGENTGDLYLLAYYYEVNGIGFAGLSPDPDIIFNKQGDGMSDEALAWLDAKLDEVDPDGTKVIFVNCHYVIDGRGPTSSNDRSTYHAERLIPIFLGHNNLFHLYGHWETWFDTNTVNNLFHYDTNGNLVGIAGNETSSDQVLSAEDRGFNAVYMGHFRPMQGDHPDWFYDDAITGDGGKGGTHTEPSTATPKIAQGMYIEVFEDRIVFTMKNFGILPGFETGTELVPYTVYLNK